MFDEEIEKGGEGNALSPGVTTEKGIALARVGAEVRTDRFFSLH
jgi:hypothetical protein